MPARMSVRFFSSAVAAGALVLAGCGYYEGGNMRSMDRHVFVSTSWQPKTVNLVDTRNGETIWSVDVPVGQKLAMEFVDNKNVVDERPANSWLPDTMRWGLGSAEHTSLSLSNEMSVPPASVRRIEWTLRPVPESPAAADAMTGEDVYVLPEDALPEATPEGAPAQEPETIDIPEDEG